MNKLFRIIISVFILAHVCFFHVEAIEKANNTKQTYVCNTDSNKNLWDISNYTMLEGLSSNSINAIAQDSIGFLWLATDNGLVRYDGFKFKKYRLDYKRNYNFLTNNIISLTISKKGNIWLGTNLGLTIFNPSTEEIKSIECPKYIRNKITEIKIISEDQMMILAGSGIYMMDIHSYNISKIGKYRGTSILDDELYVWIGTWDKGLLRYNKIDKSLVRYSFLYNKGLCNISGIVKDKRDYLWISTWEHNKLFCLKEPLEVNSNNYETYSHDENNSLLSDIQFDIAYNEINDQIVIGTVEGLSIINLSNSDSNIETFQADKLGGEQVTTVFIDRQNILWCATQGNGLSKIIKKTQHFSHINYQNHHHNLMVTSLFQMNPNELWIGVRKDVLYIYNLKTNKITHYSDIPILNQIKDISNAILCIYKDRFLQDTYWLGTRYDGLYKLIMHDDKIESIERLRKKTRVLRNIQTIAQDSKGNLWLGGESGCCEIFYNGDSKMHKVKSVSDMIGNSGVNYIYNDGVYIWIGTNTSGLIRMDANGNFLPYNMQNGKLNYNVIESIKKDSKGNLLVGTLGGGLSVYDKSNDTFNMIQSLAELSNDLIYNIMEDSQNYLWLATDQGLVKFDIEQNKVLATYSKNNGIENNMFFLNSGLALSDGRLFWGGYNGVDILDFQFPDRIVARPKVTISSMSVDNIPITRLYKKRKHQSCLTSPYIKNLVLKYNQDNISFSLSSLSYKNIDCKYAYRLSGIDNRWLYTNDNERSITYNILTSGKYKLQVKSCDEYGTWSEPIVIDIKKLPPPWLTFWAIIIYIIILSLVLLFIFREINRRLQLMHSVKYEKMKREKSEELYQAKLQFFTNISHELFTPISVLVCATNILAEDNQNDTKTLNIMRVNLERLRRLLQQIMEFRKSKSGNLKLKVEKGELVQFIRELSENDFLPLAKANKINLHFESKESEIYTWFDRDKMDKILYNIISNAIKYNIPHGYVKVNLQKTIKDHRSYVEIHISNSGEGITPDRIDKLFTRFYDGQYREHNTTGTGIGLSLSKDLVTLHHGTIIVKSEVNKETTFIVTIPIDDSSYMYDEKLENYQIKNDTLSQTSLSPEDNKKNREEDNILNYDKKPTILLVEDNVDLVNLLKNILKKQFTVYTALNGVEGLKILKNNEDIDLVVTDYIMPIMDGVELCKTIRSDISLSYLPLILLTAKVRVNDQIIGLEAGADYYMTKPFEPKVLVLQIQNMLNHIYRIRQRYQDAETVNESIKATGELSKQDHQFLEKVLNLVNDNISDIDFSNEKFYQAMAMSQSTLYRKLKAVTGFSPNEFIRDIRIKKACEIIQNDPNIRIADVAYEVGVADAKYFSTLFKKVKGITPKDYAAKLL